jgi:predicted amidohydrolase
MNNLRISLVQTELVWEDPQANRALLGDKIAQCGETDLIVLPEMFTTGFSMAANEHAEPMGGPTVTWLAEQAARQCAVVTGSLIVRDGERRYNRLIWMRPDGCYRYYDKRHLFRLAGEHTHYCAGEQRLIVELNGWRICPMICYDLRFPVFSRNRDDYDLLIYVANWPSARHQHWKTLLVARAIENLAYVAGVNRVGKDGNQLRYRGDSCVIDMSGGVMFSQADREFCKTLRLDAAALSAWRERLPFHLDADSFQLGF